MNEKIARIGLGCIVIRDGQVLIGKRKGSHGSGTWSIPGGHVEFGESWEECARREVKEETGLDINQIQFLGVTDDYDIGEDKHYVTIFMKASSMHGEPFITEPDKYIEQRWCKWEHIPSPRFKPLENLMRQGVHPLATYHGKLVRDRIPEIIHSRGERVSWHIASANEYKEALKTKLAEEVLEYLDSGEIVELADILEVIHSLTALEQIPREQLQLIQKKKQEKRGGFDQKIMLDTTQ